MTDSSHQNSTCVLQYLETGIRISASETDITWLREFFTPSLQESAGGQIDVQIEFLQDINRYRESEWEFAQNHRRDYDCFTLDGRFESFPGSTNGGGELCVALERFRVFLRTGSRSKHVQMIAANDSAKSRLALMRVVREVATASALQAEAIPIHGSACSRNERGIGFIGHKRSGKTTSLLHHLLNKGFQFLSNDRFFLIKRDGRWVVRGMPTIVKIRRSCFELFPVLLDRLDRHHYHRERTLEEIKSAPGKISATEDGVSLSQAQFLKITDSQPRTDCFLDRLMLPRRDDRVTTPVHRKLSPANALQAISENLLKPAQTVSASEVFCPAFDKTRYQTILQERLKQLVDEVPVYELKQNARTITQVHGSDSFRDAA